MILILLQLWLSTRDAIHPDPSVYLEGVWQSCQSVEEDGEAVYAERIYDHPSKPAFEFHMGPRDEFALFLGVAQEHRDHDSKANLLYPAYRRSDLSTYRDARNWTAKGLYVSVVRAGGSRDECEAYDVLVRRKP